VTRTATQKTGVNTGVSYADNLVAATAQGTYQYRVSAVNTSGVAPAPTVNVYSAPATMPSALDFTVPTAPTTGAALAVSAGAIGSGAVTLSWPDFASNETGYTVQRATNATFTRGLVTTAVPGAVNGGTVSYTLSGMTAGTLYFYRVAATNAVGTSAYLATTTAVAVP
jgi:hypothetical protein